MSDLASIPYDIIKNVDIDSEDYQYVREHCELPPPRPPSHIMRRPSHCKLWAKLNGWCEICRKQKPRCIMSSMITFIGGDSFCIECIEQGLGFDRCVNKCWVCQDIKACVSHHGNDKEYAVCLDCLNDIIQDAENGIVTEWPFPHCEYK